MIPGVMLLLVEVLVVDVEPAGVDDSVVDCGVLGNGSNAPSVGGIHVKTFGSMEVPSAVPVLVGGNKF